MFLRKMKTGNCKRDLFLGSEKDVEHFFPSNKQQTSIWQSDIPNKIFPLLFHNLTKRRKFLAVKRKVSQAAVGWNISRFRSASQIVWGAHNKSIVPENEQLSHSSRSKRRIRPKANMFRPQQCPKSLGLIVSLAAEPGRDAIDLIPPLARARAEPCLLSILL